jgi:hypothetical protein
MKIQKHRNPPGHKLTVLHQLSKLIPAELVHKAERASGVDKMARAFSGWSHVLTMLFAHQVHTLSLWDLTTSIKHHGCRFGLIRGAHAPSRNALSHANKTRPSIMIEQLFWDTLNSVQVTHPSFKKARRYVKLPKKFKRAISAIDSSVLPLVANCMDWASHRRQKAAAKVHLRLSLNSFLPSFVIINSARGHDSTKARELCAHMQAGEIVVADRAYNDFSHLADLDGRNVFWVVRAKTNLKLHVCKKRGSRGEGILRDDEVTLKATRLKKIYGKRIRRVRARVLLDEKWVVMEFLTNNFEWSPKSIADLYQARWGIEVFFKEIKQTLKLSSFLGYSENAIRWQVWSALLLYLLLRLLSHLHEWPHSFRKLYALIRGVLWDRFNLVELMRCYGTAPCAPAFQPALEQLELAPIYTPFMGEGLWDSIHASMKKRG